jgi:prophage antirepressor-like protein
MNKLITFESDEFGDIRVIEIVGEPWFVTKDVAEILGYGRTYDMARRLNGEEFDNVEYGVLPHTNQRTGRHQLTIINEPGLYRATIRSNLPKAEHFQDWVVEDVIPSIRKTGAGSSWMRASLGRRPWEIGGGAVSLRPTQRIDGNTIN